MVKPKSANYLSYRVPIKSQQNHFLPQHAAQDVPWHSPFSPSLVTAGWELATLVLHKLAPTLQATLAITVVLCSSCTTLPLGKLQQGHTHCPVYINPLCSEHSNNNSHPPSLACQPAFSNLESLQRWKSKGKNKLEEGDLKLWAATPYDFVFSRFFLHCVPAALLPFH